MPGRFNHWLLSRKTLYQEGIPALFDFGNNLSIFELIIWLWIDVSAANVCIQASRWLRMF